MHTTAAVPPTPTLWNVEVNASVTHGPMPYVDAVIFSELVIAVPGVVDVELLPVDAAGE